MARGGRPVQVYFAAAERRQLDELCARTGRTLSDEVRRAVRRHLAAPPVVAEPDLPRDEVAAPRARGPKGKRKGKR